MKIKLAIVIPVYICKMTDTKNLSRPTEFLDIKLFSIQKQVNKFFDVDVVVSDMSPDLDISNSLKEITSRYGYLYTHQPMNDVWNKALCLNRGIKSIIDSVDYVMTTDYDIFFSDVFFSRLYSVLIKEKNKVLLAQTFMLNKEKSEYFVNLSREKKLQDTMLNEINMRELLPHGNYIDFHANGGVQVFQSKWLSDIHGYDEEFKLWGGVDNEILSRLEHAGIYREFLVPKNSELLLCHLDHSRQEIEGVSDITKKKHQMINLTRVQDLITSKLIIVNPDGWGE